MTTLAGDTDFLFNRINTARKEFNQLYRRFNKFIETSPKELSIKWQDELLEVLSPVRGNRRTELFREILKKYRLLALEILSNSFYKDLWYIRSEVEMSLIILKMGPISQFINFSMKWEEEQLNDVKPIVLRMKNPKTIPPASKLRSHKGGLEFEESIRQMFLPFQKMMDDTRAQFKKIICPETLSQIEVEIAENATNPDVVVNVRKKYLSAIEEIHKKRKPYTTIYRKLFLVRNNLNFLTQSASPRVDFKQYLRSIQNNEKSTSND